MFLTSLKQICNEYLIKFSENQSAPKLENRKTSPCSPCAPNLLHVLMSRTTGYHNLCSPVSDYAKVCQSMLEYARVCQSMPEYARVCQSMPEYARVRLEICRDRRSCKIFPSYVKFWGNNANSLGNYRVTYALNE